LSALINDFREAVHLSPHRMSKRLKNTHLRINLHSDMLTIPMNDKGSEPERQIPADR
jgi:hypothetical protein